MKSIVCAAAVLAAAVLVLATPAQAQNLSLRAPQWAQAALSADVTPTTGGRPMIAAEGVALSVRSMGPLERWFCGMGFVSETLTQETTAPIFRQNNL